jgi:hypothetical protein
MKTFTIIQKTALSKINPEKLFFVHHCLVQDIFIHEENGQPVKKKGFDGAARFDEKNTEIILKANRHFEAISVLEMSNYFDVYLTFPEGHPLHNDIVLIRKGEYLKM